MVSGTVGTVAIPIQAEASDPTQASAGTLLPVGGQMAHPKADRTEGIQYSPPREHCQRGVRWEVN
jgi:hypothetical protein